jgi:hypothetical protein
LRSVNTFFIECSNSSILKEYHPNKIITEKEVKAILKKHWNPDKLKEKQMI